MTHAKWFHKLDSPQPKWPIATFPKIQYPLHEFERENHAEVEKSLAEVRNDLRNSVSSDVLTFVGIDTFLFSVLHVLHL